ncbi:MAG: hypothetical protein D3921_03460 [Candidatus Electrothrix sp. AW1]|nr:hypothetical protein [Candidatus Electrothrix gigas]
MLQCTLFQRALQITLLFVCGILCLWSLEAKVHAEEGKCLTTCVDGKGVMQYPDGSTYTGEWKHGQRHGKGILLYPDGRKYEGNFVHDQLDGKGIITLPDGRIIESQWKKGKQIVARFANGDIFTGTWTDGRFYGKATVTLPNGDRYSGGFKGSKYEGYGVMSYADGCKYTGEFKNGKFHGKGAISLLDGTVIKSDWKEGHPIP